MEGLKGWCKAMGQLALLREGRKDPPKGGERLKPARFSQPAAPGGTRPALFTNGPQNLT